MPGLTTTKEAYVTLVTNAEYGLGAAVLGYQLCAMGTTRHTVVMVTSSVTKETRELLATTWDHVVDVSEMQSHDVDRLALMERPELGVTFSKLNVWKLLQYEKVGVWGQQYLILYWCIFVNVLLAVFCGILFLSIALNSGFLN